MCSPWRLRWTRPRAGCGASCPEAHLTREERIRELRTQQRRLEHLVKIRAERSAWVRKRQRADALRKRAAEETRALRSQDLVRRERLERQAERARVSKRRDMRENRSL